MQNRADGEDNAKKGRHEGQSRTWVTQTGDESTWRGREKDGDNKSMGTRVDERTSGSTRQVGVDKRGQLRD